MPIIRRLTAGAILARASLVRFERPDRLPKKVREVGNEFRNFDRFKLQFLASRER